MACHVLISCRIFITMSRRSSTTATKRRNVNDANPAPAPKSDWLSVFAAASMFIGDDVMEGSLFPMTDTASLLSPNGTPFTKLTAKDFGPIILHDPAAFYQLIGELYAALQQEQQTKDHWAGDDVDPALLSIRICSTDPTPFLKQFRKFGYAAMLTGDRSQKARGYAKRKNFHLVPDRDTVNMISKTLSNIGYQHNLKKSSSLHKWQQLLTASATAATQCPLPAEGTHWLDVFAAVAMYIDNSVMRGGLFAKPGAKSHSADDFDRIVICSRSRFFRAAHHLYSAVKREQSTSKDPALTSIRIFCPNPETFVAQFGRFGYRRVDEGASMATENENGEEEQEEQPEVYAKDPVFHTHISPNAERARVIYNVLKEMDFIPKQGFGPPCHSKESIRIPNPSPTTVADTGFTTVGNTDATATGTTTANATTNMKSAVTKSIPELNRRRDSEASTGTAATFVGNVTIDKSIVPSTIAHHAAITAFRTATKSVAKPATGTLGMNWDFISDASATNSALHSSIPPPPLSVMISSRQIEEDSVAEGVTITPPELITIEDDGQYPSLPASASNATGASFVPWVDVTEAPASDVPEEMGTVDVEEGLNIPEWYKNVEEYHNSNNLLPIGAKDGALVHSGEDGDDHLSVMSTSLPISAAIAIAEDDLSSCPSINCDGQDDALIPFINY